MNWIGAQVAGEAKLPKALVIQEKSRTTPKLSGLFAIFWNAGTELTLWTQTHMSATPVKSKTRDQYRLVDRDLLQAINARDFELYLPDGGM